MKVAEHILTGHKVAIKILNRRKIKQMDMEEKGAWERWIEWGGACLVGEVVHVVVSCRLCTE